LKILVIDVGGTNVKILASGQPEPRKYPSGQEMSAKHMVATVKELAAGWKYEAVSIGYPGPVVQGRPLREPHNLAPGWVGFNFETAFKCPVKVINDAAMQALGSYKKGTLLFLGLGTGLGSALVVDGRVQPLELAHLPYRDGTFEDYVGLRGLEKRGKKKWRKHVASMVEHLSAACLPDEIVIGGGNAKKLDQMPPRCTLGTNANAFLGGFRLWWA